MGLEAGRVVVVDKPAGITSAGVVAAVKKMFGARKAGHAGTLDPFATGVLVCCLNQATRLAQFFLHGEKAYDATLCLGVETDTQDATGRIVASADRLDLEPDDVRAAFERFKGEIEQVPPAYSALKHRGVPLYKLARRGTPVRKAARRVVVTQLEIRAIRLPEVRFDVVCSAGTYVRTLCADIGAMLGCGGHLKTLRRVASGGFTIAEAVALETLERQAGPTRLDAVSISMADALRHMPAAVADASLAERIRHGRKLSARDLGDAPGGDPGLVKILDAEGDLLAVLAYNRITGRYEYRANLQ